MSINNINHRHSYSEPIKRNAQKIFKKSNKVWGYLSKKILLTRHALNIALKTHKFSAVNKEIGPQRITSAITHLKVFSVIGIPFLIASIPDAVKNIFKQIRLRDKEGVALTSLSFVVIAGDLVDSVSTVVNNSLMLADKIPIGFLSSIGIPLSLGIVGLSSIHKSVQLAKTHLVYKKLTKEVLSKTLNRHEMVQNLWTFLDQNLGLMSEKQRRLDGLLYQIENMSLDESTGEIEKFQKEIDRLKALHKSKLERSTSPEIVEKLEEILEMLKQNQEINDEQLRTTFSKLDQIVKDLKKKMGVDVGNLIANIFTIVGLALLLTAVPAVLGLLLLTIGVLIKLSLLLYQDITNYKKII